MFETTYSNTERCNTLLRNKRIHCFPFFQ